MAMVPLVECDARLRTRRRGGGVAVLASSSSFFVAGQFLTSALLFFFPFPRGAAGFIFNASLKLHPSDLKVLEAFKASMTNHHGLLDSWNNSIGDPCTWAGVKCACSDIYPRLPEVHACPDADSNAAHNRVVFLDFGAGVRPSNTFLVGTITPELGNLEELRNVHLDHNQLTGTVPGALGNLRHLNRLLLNFNALTGTLPPELAASNNIRDLYLNGNDLIGGIPEEWCQLVTRNDSIHSILSVAENDDICGVVPDCFTALKSSTSAKVGTYLLDGSDVTGSLAHDGRVSGYCDLTPPACGSGCAVEVPAIATSLSYFAFSFKGFDDLESGIRGYRWGLGTAPGLANAYAMRPYMKDSSQNMSAAAVHVASYASNATALINGVTYYVSVEAENLAGPPLTAMAISSAILVDATPAVPPDVVYPTAACELPSNGVLETSITDRVTVCWAPFTEPESWVERYEVALENRAGQVIYDFEPANSVYGGRYAPTAIDNSGGQRQKVNLTHELTGLSLQSNTEYVAVIRSWNAGNMSSLVRSHSFRVIKAKGGDVSGGISIVGLTYIIVFLCAAAGVLVAVTYRHMRDRHELTLTYTKLRERHAEALRVMLTTRRISSDSYTTGSLETGVDETIRFLSQLSVNEKVCFVITDLEGSTAASNSDPQAYKYLQETHDCIMRELIDAHHGRELNTQGDAFEIIFRETSNALMFCQEVQRRLLEEDWPKSVLRLPHCGRVLGVDAKYQEGGSTAGVGLKHAQEVLYSGPRVRMAVHVAKRGEFSCKLHDMSKHLVFEGEGFNVARVISDAAHGGQVLLTAAALKDLLSAPGGLTAAGNPVIQRVGFFDLSDVLASPSAPLPRGSVATAAKEAFPLPWENENAAANVWELHQALPRWGSRVPWRQFSDRLCLQRAIPAQLSVELSSRSLRTMNIVPVDSFLRRRSAETGVSKVPRNMSIVVVHSLEPMPRQSVTICVNLVMAITQQFGGVVIPLHDSPLSSSELPPRALSNSKSLTDVREASALQALSQKKNNDHVSNRPRLPSSPILAGVHRSAASMPNAHVLLAVNDPLKLFSSPVALLFHSASNACSCASTIQLACAYAFWKSSAEGTNTAGKSKSKSSSLKALSISSSRASEVPKLAFLMHSSDDMHVERVNTLPSTWMDTPPISCSSENASGTRASRGKRSIDGIGSPFEPSNFALAGVGAAEAGLLVAMVNEAQVVLTEPAWKKLQLRVPSHVTFLSLGRHLIRPGHAMDLMQATPSAIVEKNFPPLKTVKQLTPGYFDSPDASRGRGVAIVFCRMPSGTAQEISRWALICREACEASSGYECKEPDPGKFTLAFHTLADALRFGTRALRRANDCGLRRRVCIGSAFGKDLFRKPLGASGRADYFGSTANLAARIMGQAHPGQMLVEFTEAPESYGLTAALHRDTAGGGIWKASVCGDVEDAEGSFFVRLSGVGIVSLKGVQRPTICAQVNAWDDDISDEDIFKFPPPKGWTRHVESGVTRNKAVGRSSLSATPAAKLSSSVLFTTI